MKMMNGRRLWHWVARLILAIMASLGLGITSVHAQEEAIPDFYKDPGFYPNRNYVGQDAGENIDPFTGAVQLQYTDIHLPGDGGFDLDITRSYSSLSVDPADLLNDRYPLGIGWTFHFGRILRKQNSNACVNVMGTVAYNPVLELADGSRQLLAYTGSSSPLALTTQRWRADCMNDNSGGLRIYSPNGVQYEMTHHATIGSAASPIHLWYATKITDRNGNSATIKYASESHEITGITTSDGRTVSFTYTGTSGSRSRRITSIMAEGQAYNYAYTSVSGSADTYQLTSVTRPDGTTWRYDYNGNLNTLPGSHVLQKLTYPQGGTISYQYGYVYFDSQANPTSRAAVVTRKTTSAGGTWNFTYTPGNINVYDTTRVDGPDGTTTYRHVGPNYSTSGTVWMVGLLMSKAIENVQTETYTWDKQMISDQNYFRPGAFVAKVDADTYAPIMTKKAVTLDGATYTTTFSSFDSYGNPMSLSESGPGGGSRSTNLTYLTDPSKWLIRTVRSRAFSGSSMSRTFDSSGNMTAETVNGVTTSYTYDGNGNISSKTFPRSLHHNYSSYYRGIPRSESQPESVSISRTVSGAGNVTSETNGDGRTTNYAYDAMNRLTSVQPPAGNSISISYTATTRRSTRGGLTQEIVYDGFGYPIKYTLGGIVKNYKIDALGRRTFESDPDSSQGTTYDYDILGRVVSIKNSDGSAKTMTYGSGTKTVKDERGNSTTYTYRSYGNPAQQILMGISAPESSANVTLARNSVDLVTSVSQGGQTRNYGYDSNYYLTSASNPETGSTTYGRDAAGNMTSKKVGSAATVSYTYDGQNRLTAVSYSDSTPGISYTYNKTDKMLSANSSTGSRAFTYDGNNNLLTDSLTVDGYQFTIKYAYNGNDILSSMTYPRSQRVVDYAPDALGRPTKVSGYVTGVTYWPSGQIRDITYANGVTTSYGQNSRLWPSSIAVKKGSSTYVNSSYSYDTAGNVTGISDSIDPSYARTLAYDRINRLMGANGPWGAGAIAYDGTGNITQQRFGSNSLNYSYSSNRLASVSGALSGTFTYDAQGNIVAGLGDSYEYDSVPNLKCFNCSNASQKIEYGYDGTGHRSSVFKENVRSYEMHDMGGNQIIEFTPAPSNKLTEYIYLAGKRIAQQQ